MLEIGDLDLEFGQHTAGLLFTGCLHVIVDILLCGLHRLNDIFLHSLNLLLM